MLEYDQLLLLIAVLIPLSFSPGPSNMACAAAASRNGVAPILPFVAGLQLIPFLYTIVIGMGAGYLLQTYSFIQIILRYVGVSYMFYMAYHFFKAEGAGAAQEVPVQGFWQGVVLQVFNSKIITIIVMITSQFITPANSHLSTVALLGLIIGISNMASQLLWAFASDRLLRKHSSGFLRRHVAKVYGTMMLATGIFMML